MAASLSSSVTSLQSSLQLLDSSIDILDSGVSDFPRLSKVLRTRRVCRIYTFQLGSSNTRGIHLNYPLLKYVALRAPPGTHYTRSTTSLTRRDHAKHCTSSFPRIKPRREVSSSRTNIEGQMRTAGRKTQFSREPSNLDSEPE